MSKYNPTITVCDACLRACCWQGEFMCDESFGAGTTEKPVSRLIHENTEHPDYWNKDLDMGNRQLLTAKDLKALGVKDKNMLDLSV